MKGTPYTVTYSYSATAPTRRSPTTRRSVTRRPGAPTITAQAATKAYGDADPAFSANFERVCDRRGPQGPGRVARLHDERAGRDRPVGTYSVTPVGLSSPDLHDHLRPR